MKASKVTNTLLISIAVVIILIYGKNLLIPFVLALIFWFLIKEMRYFVKRVKFIKKNVPDMVLNLLGFAVIFLILGGFVKILSSNISQLSTSTAIYQKNINVLIDSINSTFNIDLSTSIKEFSAKYNYTEVLKNLFNSLRDIFSKAMLIIVYALFILFEEPFFSQKIHKIYNNNPAQEKQTNQILKQIDKSIGRYLSVKTLMGLLTAFCSYFALLFIGIEAPLFWAFLIFLMNFIPAIGSLIATIFPAVFAMMQFGTVMPGVWTLIIVGAIQLFIGNYVDPKITGDFLNVSPLIIILGLSFWGAIWGVVGMLLSVPISVMLILIFANIPSTKWVAILLSKKGRVENVIHKIEKE